MNQAQRLAYIFNHHPNSPVGARFPWLENALLGDIQTFIDGVDLYVKKKRKATQTKPLKRKLESGAKGRTLSNYFEFEELEKHPDVRVHGISAVEESDREIATELLQRLQKITLEEIVKDIAETLDQHYEKGLASASPEHSYNHKSEYVQISAHRPGEPEKGVTTFLKPARSYGAIKEGYEGVHYPTYYVELALQ